MTKKNIVLVTYDSLRADHCGFMGYDRDTTPVLDELAEEGIVFENAIASGVPTIASMTAVMTGEHSLASPEIGFNTEQREQVTSRPTVAEVLSDAGYSTGGLSPNPPASSYFGFDDGFDWFEDFLAEDAGVLERVWNQVFQRSIEGGDFATYARLFKNVVTKDEILRPWADFYNEILAWRERVEEPYFLWVLLLEPHHPWMPPADYQRWSSRLDKYRAFRQYYEMFTNGWRPDFDDRERQRLVDLYDDSIRYGDAFLERLQRDLADDDPVYLVHADHGEEFGSHGRFGHQADLYEDLVHVPLVVGGNIDRSESIEHPVALRQLAPTISELGDASHAYTSPSLLEEPPRPWVIAKVFANGERRIAIRTQSGKYITEPGREELYNLASDPDEQQDMSTEHTEIVDAFRRTVDHHTWTEHEKRLISDTVTEVGGSGL